MAAAIINARVSPEFLGPNKILHPPDKMFLIKRTNQRNPKNNAKK